MSEAESTKKNRTVNDPDGEGGLGGQSEFTTGARDIRMLARAVDGRWPIKPEYRQAIIQRMVRAAADPKTSERSAAIAARVLVQMERQNQVDEHQAIQSGEDQQRESIAPLEPHEETSLMDDSIPAAEAS